MSNVVNEKHRFITRVKGVGTRSFSRNQDYLTSKVLPPDDKTAEHHWFGMYVRYKKEMDVKLVLDEMGFQTFIPMRCVPEASETSDAKHRNVKMTLVPALHNFIFIFSYYARIRWVKMYDAIGRNMQFLRVFGDDVPAERRYIPTCQMQQFIEASKRAEDDARARYVVSDNVSQHIGKTVRFVRGDYEGLEGTLKRVEKNRMVVIDLQGIMSLALPIERIVDIEMVDKENNQNKTNGSNKD